MASRVRFPALFFKQASRPLPGRQKAADTVSRRPTAVTQYIPIRRNTGMATYAEHIASLEDTRAEKSARMKAIHQKAVDEKRTMAADEIEEFDTLDNEIKSIAVEVERTQRLKAMEDADKQTVKAVDGKAKENATASTTALSGGNLQLKTDEKLPPGIAFARLARVKALAFTGQMETRDATQIAKHMYPGDNRLISALQVKAPVTGATTLSPTWAGNLINEGDIAFADFVEYLRPRTLLGQIQERLRRLPFDTPVLIQGSGGSAKWVKEGVAKPLTEWSYTRAKLTPLKVASIAVATKETLMRASIAADTLIRDELARSIGATLDTTFISNAAAVADESPAGILNSIAPLTLSGGTTVADIRCDIATFLTSFADANLSLAGTFWIMPERIAIALSLIANEVGAAAFPGITPNGGTFAGLPVFVTSYADTDSDGSVVALVRGDDIFLADEGGISVSVSDQASLLMDNAPNMNVITPVAAQVVSLWQTNSIGFLCERFMNWQRRRAAAVSWARVNWSACTGSP